MKVKWIRIGMAAFGLSLFAVQVGAGDAPVLATQKAKNSYALGVDLAKNIKKTEEIDIDKEALLKGMQDGLSGSQLLMTEDEIQSALKAAQRDWNTVRVKKKVAVKNKRNSTIFLMDNGKKEGVVTLPSGLQYKILAEGKGKKPSDSDTVECKYRGTKIDGREFDNSSEPKTFKLAEVIPGWREALKLMPEGSRWQVFIPSQLAYGEQGKEGVDANETLIYELELLAVK